MPYLATFQAANHFVDPRTWAKAQAFVLSSFQAEEADKVNKTRRAQETERAEHLFNVLVQLKRL